jgi:prepilin-type N-terminal cleavage/methylation domain-containing protein
MISHSRMKHTLGPLRQGITLVEIMVVIMIGSLVVALGHRLFEHLSYAGVKMDRHTAGWHTYSRVIDVLRADLRGAISANVSGPSTLQLHVVTLTHDLRRETTQVVWQQRGTRELVRTAAGREQVFSFEPAFDPGEELKTVFRVLP